MPQVFLLKKAQLPNASCASYVISDADLPQNLSEIEIKLSGQDEKELRDGVSSTADAPTIAILLGRDGEAYSIDEPYLKAVFSCGAKVKLIHYFHPAEQLKEVENTVNENILRFIPVEAAEMTMDEARAKGAMALFGEKYGDIVRMVSCGDVSRELCGGIHVGNTGQIGAFKIVSEAGVASGVRRIEAVTGLGLLKREEAEEAAIKDASAALKTVPASLAEKAAATAAELKAVKKELDEAKKAAMGDAAGDLYENAKEINGKKLITVKFDGAGIDELRSLSDDIKKKYKGVVMVLAAVNEPKVTFLVSVTDDLVEAGVHAGKLVKEIAAACGGGGGGKADMAQAGAKDSSKISDAFTVAESLLK